MLIDNILKGITYSINGHFACAEDFADFITSYIRRKKLCLNKDKLIKTIDALIFDFANPQSEISQLESAKMLMVHDLKQMKSRLLNYEFDNLKDILKEHFKIFTNELESKGLKINSSINIVEDFPPPYKGVNANAMSYDIGDKKAYGLKIGIYLKQRRIMPFFTTGVIAHELIHQLFGQYYFDYLARGLEDGFCDFVAYMMLCPKVFSLSISRNVLFNRRLTFPLTQFRAIYTESLRQVFLIYKNYGLDGVNDILSKGKQIGREIIKKVERDCITKGYDKLTYLGKGNWVKQISQIADTFIGYPYSLVVSPLARLIAEKIEIGVPISQMLNQSNINHEEGMKALTELQNKVYLVFLHKGKVVCDETKPFIQANMLRYSLKKLVR